LRYTKSRKVFIHIWRMRGKALCVHGDDAKKLLTSSPNTPRDTKMCNKNIYPRICQTCLYAVVKTKLIVQDKDFSNCTILYNLG